MIKPETLKEFQSVVKRKYGTELTIQEAEEILTNWVGYFSLLAKIDAREEKPTEKEQSVSGGNTSKPSKHLKNVL